MSLTFTDIFCGAGGSSIGLAAAGFERVVNTPASHFTATCAAPGCGNTVSPGQVMCSGCASR